MHKSRTTDESRGFPEGQVLPPADEPHREGCYQKSTADLGGAEGGSIASLSPRLDRVLGCTPVLHPPISEIARPFVGLAGLRIDTAANSARGVPIFRDFVLIRLSDGAQTRIDLPEGAQMSCPQWAPGGQDLALAWPTTAGTELWTVDAATGKAQRRPDMRLNGVFGEPYAWISDTRLLLCRLLPEDRGAPPPVDFVPRGPIVKEALGTLTRAPRHSDLLQTEHDCRLFEYYATSQLAAVDVGTGRTQKLGAQAVIRSAVPSPDGNYYLVAKVLRPYSYAVRVGSFAHCWEVWNRSGVCVREIARVALNEKIPMQGVVNGARCVHWRQNEPSTLAWTEAVDGGDPGTRARYRDRLMQLRAPFAGEPEELTRVEHRLGNVLWSENRDYCILIESIREQRRWRGWLLGPRTCSSRLCWDVSEEDRYGCPGTPVMRILPRGECVVAQYRNFIYLSGRGCSPEGDRPFLDRFNVETMASERLFTSRPGTYETVAGLLAADGSSFLTRYETPSTAPTYLIHRHGRNRTTPLQPRRPSPEFDAFRKQRVTYRRADGVPLSMTVHLPPGCKPGERRPAILWAYPAEYRNADLAGQIDGSAHRFPGVGGLTETEFLRGGYVVLAGASVPVIGDPRTANSTYIQQVTASAEAAVEAADAMQIVDPDRIAIVGVSYGAAMAVTALATSRLFCAGIAISGAYNRTLTPFGFQRERRTLWEDRELYLNMSPLLYADRIKAPLLLLHGACDENPGTPPLQAELMFHAVSGNGGVCRLVLLPGEGHRILARESVDHVVWEVQDWLRRFVTNRLTHAIG